MVAMRDLGIVEILHEPLLVAQTVFSAVSQVRSLRAWLDSEASLVFTPCRLPVGDTADYQSTTSLRYVQFSLWQLAKNNLSNF